VGSSTGLKPTPPFIYHKTTKHVVSWNVNAARRPKLRRLALAARQAQPRQYRRQTPVHARTWQPRHVLSQPTASLPKRRRIRLSANLAMPLATTPATPPELRIPQPVLSLPPLKLTMLSAASTVVGRFARGALDARSLRPQHPSTGTAKVHKNTGPAHSGDPAALTVSCNGPMATNSLRYGPMDLRRCRETAERSGLA
jgi:hypothetical protein